MLQPMAEVLDTEEEAMEEDILPKFVVIVERRGIPLIHAIKSMAFHLISCLKIRIMIGVILMQFFIIQISIIMSRIMKVQSQKWSLNKLVLLLSSIKHCQLFYNRPNPVAMLLIKSLLFPPIPPGNNFISSFTKWTLSLTQPHKTGS